MSKLRTFRIDGWNLEKCETEFIAKINDDDSQLLGTFDMAGDGIYYYRSGSQILTPKENPKTRETYDGFIEFEALKEIFEHLSELGWDRDTHIIKVNKEDNTVSLQIAEDE